MTAMDDGLSARNDANTTEPPAPVDPGWVTWLVDAEEQYNARVLLIPGYRGQPQAYLLPRRLN